ncbi:bifunctional DNA-formamidopyrimidine glycosylase/DNA-(apurinic or apyrimidinic site) lyase [Bdellovibrio sp. HCB337]|uniref:bifunctional DNA-formamidopyrimidine glycosylase/DNA-(apurinic or apyrimidinic site) lyase n=1 Tax=Bdellovibrio sp. HCB337 TaxID=3394358 RepID=UPI0039A6191A
MPELPEVETVRKGLEEILKDHPAISKIELKRKDLRDPIPVKKVQSLVGQKITSIERRAKYLLLKTPQGSLLSHLGMTGTWRVAVPGDERDHDHIYLHFANGLRLAYRDPRRFGVFDFIAKEKELEHPKLKALGYEPLSDGFTGQALWSKLRGKIVPIKVAIMDQKIVVGVGNIYASEALFRAGIRPTNKSVKISLEKCDRLVSCIKEVLTEAIAAGGSSISDYEQATGESGYFQKKFRVYDRKGEPCVVCRTQISAQILGGRSTYWCSSCQK